MSSITASLLYSRLSHPILVADADVEIFHPRCGLGRVSVPCQVEQAEREREEKRRDVLRHPFALFVATPRPRSLGAFKRYGRWVRIHAVPYCDGLRQNVRYMTGLA